MLAAGAGYTDLVDLPLQYGASMELTGTYRLAQYTSLSVAASDGHTDTMELLI